MARPARLQMTKSVEVMTVDRAMEWIDSLDDDDAKKLLRRLVARETVMDELRLIIRTYLKSRRKGMREQVRVMVDREIAKLKMDIKAGLFTCPNCGFITSEWNSEGDRISWVCNSKSCIDIRGRGIVQTIRQHSWGVAKTNHVNYDLSQYTNSTSSYTVFP